MVTPTNMIPPAYLSPQGGASLLLSFKLERKTVAIIGGNGLAASRVFAALEADAKVIVLCEDGELGACDELKWRAAQGQISIRNTNTSSSTTIAPSSKTRTGSVFEALETLLANETIHFVCITDTILSAGKRSHASALRLVEICRSHRVLVNVTDEPALCDFSFTATHRFIDSKTGAKTPLQIGVTTNGKGCRLAGRVRREIVARLPRTVGAAAAGVSRLREMAKEGSEDEDQEQNLNVEAESGAGEEGATSTLNRPVAQRRVTDTENASDRTKRQLRWVAQVSEYWPLAQLAAMDEEDAMKILTGGFDMGMGSSSSSTSTKTTTTMATAMARPPLHSSDTDMISLHALSLSNPPAAPPRKGRILLVGSGPGHPSLLTRATYTALTELADLVLSDKLVPSAVLELIPPTVEVRIARKFPGNAEGAQTEMMEAAVEAANKGLTVVRVRDRSHVDTMFSTTDLT
jgi:uroporphyrin-III C-methyltransferase